MIRPTSASVLRGRSLEETTPTESIKTACSIMFELDVRTVAALNKVIELLSSDDGPEEYRMLLKRFEEIRGL